jgi:low temperature requirement protein LtrA
MTARDTSEQGRVSSPLELLFDLTFVIAIGTAAAELALYIEEGRGLDGIIPYLMVFFAIWWAWVNFTWFASAYDTDDVPYRILTMVQMGGVLVLAAGIVSVFRDGDLTFITVGYLVMRVALVAQWIRAGIEDASYRRVAFKYATGILIVQAAWVIRAIVPAPAYSVVVATFVVLALCEIAVPVIAERGNMTAWHPHHIAERYGLFTIIVLGESVLAISNGVQAAVGHGFNGAGLAVAVGGLVILFACWWLYFMEPAGEGLEVHRERTFLWGYGHYGVFASLAALGAGLEVAVGVAVGGEHVEITDRVAAFAVAIPVAVFLVLVWAVHAPIVEKVVVRPQVVLPAAALVLVSAFAAPAIGMAATVCVIAAIFVLTLVVSIAIKQRAAALRA